MKNKKIFILTVILTAALMVFFNVSSAQESDNDPAAAGSTKAYLDSNDAIAVRIIPNPEHYSISRWYTKQGFSGSPQIVMVDGYEAIRDGRTVYVNAANIKPDPNNENRRLIYTNIYLISYNQDPSLKTVDILGQIVKNWRFNTDLEEKTNPGPTCSISTTVCSIDADCAADQICAGPGSAGANTCQMKNSQGCVFDADCPRGFFCDSAKAKIIRDVKRISHIRDMADALLAYRKNFNTYPSLDSGSYLTGRSLSLWPSWSANFLRELSLPTSIVDPINKLGYCPGFDKKTCWNNNTNRFYEPSLNTAGNFLVLPVNSYTYSYQSATGQFFNLCSVLESEEKTVGLNFKFSPEIPNADSCLVEGMPNTSPQFIAANLSGEAGKEFVGWVRFIDEQDNPMTWRMSLTGPNWKKQQSGSFGGTVNTWRVLPVLQNTSNPNQKKIYAPEAGEPGKYEIKLEVSDGQATTTTKFLDIVITNTKPFIEAENITYKLNHLQPFIYNFYFSDDSLNNYQTAFKAIRNPGTDHRFNPLDSSLTGFSRSVKPAGNNRYKVSYEHYIPTSSKFIKDLEYSYTIEVIDKYNEVSNKNIKIRLENNPPILNFNCSSNARLGSDYTCLIGPKLQASAGNQKITYSLNPNFTNLSIQPDNSENMLLTSNRIFGNDNLSGELKIKATNEYGAFSEKKLFLKLNTYCGDGIKQVPNDENRGGIYNDGYEDCDGRQGVATGANRVASSSIDNQYACATFNSKTPRPIPNNRYCVYKSPVSGGGFCGDGYCQMKDEAGNNLENFENCPKDCRHLCKSSCNGKQCGNDGCGGSCGTCEVIGEECYGGKCCSTQGVIKMFATSDETIGEGLPFSIFFNDLKYNLKEVTPGNYTVSVPVSHDKNVLAIQASKKNFSQGITASLDHCGRTPAPISSSNLQNVKCVNSVNSNDWFKISFTDEYWPGANSSWRPDGANQGRFMIWADDYKADYSPLNNAYCRYSFVGDNLSESICQPVVLGREQCGPNLCGGSYRPDNCAAINKGNSNFYCDESDSRCTCSAQDCNRKNLVNKVQSGAEGSVCGFNVDNNCNGTIDCKYECNEGLFCNLSITTSQEKNTVQAYLNKYNRGGDMQFLESKCANKNTLNTCQKKCWDTAFKNSILVRQGDIPNTTTCSVTKVDNPLCTSYSDPKCPSECSTKTQISDGLKNDSCYIEKTFLGIKYKDWTKRKAWECSAQTNKTIWYYNDVCFQASGWKVRGDGTCGPCQPNCTNKQCGDDDGCGGRCVIQTCGTNQKCLSGTCQSCSSCSEVICGEKNDCDNECTSEGICPSGYSCNNSVCVIDASGSSGEVNQALIDNKGACYGFNSQCSDLKSETSCLNNNCSWVPLAEY